MLKRLLDDCLKGAEAGNDEDLAWLLDENHPPGTFSFHDVCDYLHLNAEFVRAFVRAGNFGRARRILIIDD